MAGPSLRGNFLTLGGYSPALRGYSPTLGGMSPPFSGMSLPFSGMSLPYICLRLRLSVPHETRLRRRVERYDTASFH